MDSVSFYGKRRKHIVLPPINQEQSDGEDSNDSEPEILAEISDNPDYMPDVQSTSRRTRVLVEETDTESESEDNHG
ncbi:hypothetical protein L9F63_013663, partial [Diploptera punctata]